MKPLKSLAFLITACLFSNPSFAQEQQDNSHTPQLPHVTEYTDPLLFEEFPSIEVPLPADTGVSDEITLISINILLLGTISRHIEFLENEDNKKLENYSIYGRSYEELLSEGHLIAMLETCGKLSTNLKIELSLDEEQTEPYKLDDVESLKTLQADRAKLISKLVDLMSIDQNLAKLGQSVKLGFYRVYIDKKMSSYSVPFHRKVLDEDLTKFLEIFDQQNPANK